MIENYEELINSRDSSGLTPLHYAILMGNDEIIENLMKKGGDLNIQDDNGETPYDIASSKQKKILDQFNMPNK